MTNLIDTLKFFTSMFTVVQVCLRLVYGLPKGALRICLPKVEKGIIYIYIYIYNIYIYIYLFISLRPYLSMAKVLTSLFVLDTSNLF